MLRKCYGRLALFCLVLLCFVHSAVTYANPTTHWDFSQLARYESTCQAPLQDLHNYLSTLPTTAVLAAQNGRVVFSYGPVEKNSIVFSVRKSILAMLYGPYVDNGTINLDATLSELSIDDVGGLLPVERQAKVRDLLSARSGVYHPASNSGDDASAAPARGTQKPGEYFLYNNWDFNAAGTIFEKLTGQNIYKDFSERFAKPLQFEDFDLQHQRKIGDRNKSAHLAYAFHLSTRDMARLGQLMLQRGAWNGQQILSSQWVDTISQTITPSKEMHPPSVADRHFGYGYLWWTLEAPDDSPLAGAYMAWGVHGQFILIIPKRQMVIAHKREVPVAGKWDVSWVKVDRFLMFVNQLLAVPCLQ